MSMNNKLSSSFDLKLNLNAPLIINNNNKYQQSTTNKPKGNHIATNENSTYCYNKNQLQTQQTQHTFIYPQVIDHNQFIHTTTSISKKIQQQHSQTHFIAFPSTATSSTANTPKSPSPSSPVTPHHLLINDQIMDDTKTESDDLSQIQERNVYEIVILDWDDTLFPTTSIVLENKKLSALELLYFGKYLYELIDELIKSYNDKNIYIITNAAKEWVFRSLKESSERYQILTQYNQFAQSMNYFAAIYNSLLSLDITVISAQDLYSSIYPSQPLIWKLNAFKQITIKHFMTINKINKYENCQYIILSIGDSEDEFTASLEAKCCLKRQIEENPYNESEILLHRIKLMDDPSPQQMMQQMIFLKSNIKNIKSVNYGKDNAITLRL